MSTKVLVLIELKRGLTENAATNGGETTDLDASKHTDRTSKARSKDSACHRVDLRRGLRRLRLDRGLRARLVPLHPDGGRLAWRELDHEQADVPDLGVEQPPGSRRLLPAAQVLGAGSRAGLLLLVLLALLLQGEQLLFLWVFIEHLQRATAGAEVGLEPIFLALAVFRCVRSCSRGNV